MKKNIKNILAILLLLSILIPVTYSYAIGTIKEASKETSFFEISKLEYNKNEKVEMLINLENIEFTKFTFELKSSENITNMEIDSNIEVEKSNDEITIEIDKSITNLNKIALYYQIPDNVEINDTIKFIATVTNIETNIDKDENENEVEEDTIGNSSNEEIKQPIEPEIMTKAIEIKVVEQTNKEENDKNENIKNEEKSQDKKDKKVNEKSNTTKTIEKSVTTQTMSSKAEQTVKYNGSDNNYLSSISIEGYKLNKEFSKDNLTYFINVGKDVNNLKITTNKVENSSTVCIYGNEDLREGTNKILISVTAENGNVRNYRIYVTKNY